MYGGKVRLLCIKKAGIKDGHDFITRYINVHFNKFTEQGKPFRTILDSYRSSVIGNYDVVDVNNLSDLVNMFYDNMKTYVPLVEPDAISKEFNEMCLEVAKLSKKKKFDVRITLSKERKFWIKNSTELVGPLNDENVRELDYGENEINLDPGIILFENHEKDLVALEESGSDWDACCWG